MIRNTISIQRKILCSCSVYSYPHAVGAGKCKQSLLVKPEFVPPKRGLAAKLFAFLDDLESQVDSLDLIDADEIETISRMIIDIRSELSGSSENSFPLN
jgi:hypothetical protein